MFYGSRQKNRLLVFGSLILILATSACSGGSSQDPTPPAAAAELQTATVAQGGATQASGAPTQAASQTSAPTLAPMVTSTATQAAALTATQPAASATQPAGTEQAAAGQPTETQAPAGQVPATGNATRFPDPSAYTWAPVVSGLNKPLGLASLPDDPQHFLIVEQPGAIAVVQNGHVLPDPYLDIQQKVKSSGAEQGLLGLALHPNYAQNGYFYINYIDLKGNTVIARYQVSKDDPNRADPNSEKVLLRVDQPYPNHNGGSMVFGPDGYLYMGLGDGGSGGDPHRNGQNKDVLLGKILRVDVDNGDPYAIPADNPFANGGGKPEVWAYGLRNPWRFSFDRQTGDLYIADVGQETWEEVDFQAAGSKGGENFGWNLREGAHPYKGSASAGTRLVDPVFEYQHGYGCSVTGGYVYHGASLPEFTGIYLLSDYCTGRVWGLIHGVSGMWQSQELFQTGFNVSSFGEDTNGEIYLFDQPKGTLYRLQGK